MASASWVAAVCSRNNSRPNKRTPAVWDFFKSWWWGEQPRAVLAATTRRVLAAKYSQLTWGKEQGGKGSVRVHPQRENLRAHLDLEGVMEAGRRKPWPLKTAPWSPSQNAGRWRWGCNSLGLHPGYHPVALCMGQGGCQVWRLLQQALVFFRRNTWKILWHPEENVFYISWVAGPPWQASQRQRQG